SLSSKDIRLFQKRKEEKDKALLSEHHSMRISQAVSLMNEMLAETEVLLAKGQRPLSRTRSTQEHRKRHMASTKGIWALVLFSYCRGLLNSPLLSERSRIEARRSFGHKVQRFTPTLGFTQSRGKNTTF
ncbi:CPLN1 protein, partial [Atlantisia rogersi]|nr:CPLN1 protein [Atlantisia rogersi]